MRAQLVGLALVAATSVVAGPARAQTAVHPSSDALYIGLRAEPGVAYLVAYDLDILITDASTGISLGPSVSIAFGGDSSTDLGRQQEYLIAADFVRARLTVGQGYGLRAMVLIGAGMYLVGLPEQEHGPHVARLEDGTEVEVRERYDAALLPGALLTGGVGGDWYFDTHWGIAAFLVGHVRLDDQNRMPALWIEFGAGIRWGE
ncbi:hypothetical protein [Sandaracinus amylolyticus]|uniref:hypothetical protein n=1 Tax=Sandaracinus amylolyticus TaxID=927083 RepID=UPI001F1E7D45|nr:hypothetical protein [Sandaracinus amylolyticus]UJR86566.1 Hypothetical protein I5071_86670 [Sandaracinus amylolyticus]